VQWHAFPHIKREYSTVLIVRTVVRRFMLYMVSVICHFWQTFDTFSRRGLLKNASLASILNFHSFCQFTHNLGTSLLNYITHRLGVWDD
jgi:hypothetical protein